MGDKPTIAYTRQDAKAYQEALRQLPSSHGKGVAKHALKAIADSRDLDVDRLSEKTIKRHFSVLNQLWEHLGEDAANPNVLTKVRHETEDARPLPWSAEDLDKLLRARWNPNDQVGNTTSEETHAWLVALGGYTGCRVEELARIRTSDVKMVEGVACFGIIRHVTKRSGRRDKTDWKPKTESGARSIPLHPKLLEAGFMELVAAREGKQMLFEMTASGPGLKLSAEYSRKFSRHKIDLGIGRETVFHSFRHNVETILGSKEVKQQWVDVFMGHSSGRGARRSVGEEVYLHGVDLAALKEVAYAVVYPEGVEPTLLLRRLRGQVPW